MNKEDFKIFTQKPDVEKSKAWMKKHWIITTLAIFFCIGLISNIFSPKEEMVSQAQTQQNTVAPVQAQEQTSQESRKIMSIVFAKSIIEEMLKSPSTAKYSNVEAYELSNEKDVWAVNGYVDSQNGFGAMLRSQWEIQLDYRDGKGGAVKSFIFDGKKIQ